MIGTFWYIGFTAAALFAYLTFQRTKFGFMPRGSSESYTSAHFLFRGLKRAATVIGS